MNHTLTAYSFSVTLEKSHNFVSPKVTLIILYCKTPNSHEHTASFLGWLKSEPTCTPKNTIKGRINNLLSLKGVSDPLNVILTVHEKFSDILKVSGAQCWGEHGSCVCFFFFFLSSSFCCAFMCVVGWRGLNSKRLFAFGRMKARRRNLRLLTWSCRPFRCVRKQNSDSMLESCALRPNEKKISCLSFDLYLQTSLSLSVCV